MSVTQYIGARYVPLFADPIDWDINRQYEPLTIVYYQGNSYTSKQAVPTNIDITNTDYWVVTGNYNAQIEQYRREVQTFDGRITANAQAIANEVTARMQQDTAIRALITALDGELDTEKSTRAAADTQIRTDFAAADSQIRRDFAAADGVLGARISTLETRTQKTDMVVIGDSFSDPDDASAVSVMWHDYVARAYNLTKHVYAKGGTGFLVGGTNKFESQADRAIAELDATKVAKVFVFGGINDVNQSGITPSTFTNAVKDTIEKLLNAFPNAQIVVMGICPTRNADATGDHESEWPDHRYDIYTTHLANGAMTARTGCVTFIPFNNFTYFSTGFYQTNNWHPSFVGHKQIASKVLGGSRSLSNIPPDQGQSLTHKPTITNRDGSTIELLASAFFVVGENLIDIALSFRADLTVSGSTNPTLNLNGYPSAGTFLPIMQPSGKMGMLNNANGSVGNGISKYNIPAYVNENGIYRINYQVTV